MKPAFIPVIAETVARFPGGEPAITNLASQPSEDGPSDRYPLNQNNAMVMNVAAAYTVYLFPV